MNTPATTPPARERLWPWFHLTLFIAAAGHFIIFRFLFAIGNQVLFEEASSVFAGHVPYRDFLLEYPPFSLAVLLPPRIFGHDTWAYGRALSYEMLIVDVGIMVLVALIARRIRVPEWQALCAYTLSIYALGSLATQRFDLWPALIVLVALFCFSRGRLTLCWVFLALGATAKLYPVLIAPLLLLYHVSRADYRGLFKGIGAAVITAGIIVIPFFLLSPHGFLESVRYQFGRGLQMETTYASVLEVLRVFGKVQLGVVFENGADNVTSPLASGLASASSFIMPFALLAVYFAYALQRRRAAAPPGGQGLAEDTRRMALFWALAVLAFMITAKVLSPQFLLWVMPLVVLESNADRWMAWGLLFAAAALSSYVFPDHYYDLMDFKPKAVAVLAARNALLVALTGLLVWWGLRERERRNA